MPLSKSSRLTRHAGNDTTQSEGHALQKQIALRNTRGSRSRGSKAAQTSTSAATDVSSSTATEGAQGLVESEERTKPTLKRSRERGGAQRVVTREDRIISIEFALPLLEGPGKRIT